MKRSLCVASALWSSVLVSLPVAASLQDSAVFGDKYRPVAPVVSQLTQIVYYRSQNPTAAESPANVYVDGRYHTSLLPGGFTSFCLRPGQHTLGAFVNDPQYLGKTEGRFAADLKGGQTYFLRVNEQQQIDRPPTPVLRHQVESEIKQTQRQIHTRSRAVSTLPCVYDHAAAQSQSHYLFANHELFKQEGGMLVLSDGGRQALNDLVVTLRQQHPLLRSLVIRIHQPDENRRVVNNKLQAIRVALTLAAIPNEVISSQTTTSGIADVQILAR